MASRFVLVALLGAGLLTLEARVERAHPMSDVGPVAAVDLSCAPDQIEMRPTRESDDDVTASGCGKTARYAWAWHHGWQRASTSVRP